MTEEDCKGHEEPPKIMPDWNKVLVSREEFLKALSLGLSGVIGLIAMIPGVGFILNYLFIAKAPKWVNIGPMGYFKEGETTQVGFHDPYILPWDGVSGHRSAWIRRVGEGSFTAFAINCTHLGCPVRWEAGADLFMCPCHGGVYYKNGDVAGGPPPRPLHRYPVRIVDNHIQIQVGTVLTEG
jgi:menaquinol-cytochrome c reductase iron-sulfur subunit